MQEGLARTYLLKADGRVVGYVSLAMSYLRKEATGQTQAKESHGNIPALLISHLSAHKEHLREGIGTGWLMNHLELQLSNQNILDAGI